MEGLEERCMLTISPVDIPVWVEQGPGPIEDGQVEGLAHPTVAGAVQAVAAGGGNRMYLGTVDGGVWRTDNIQAAGGPAWTPLTDPPPSLAISAQNVQSLAISTLTVVPGPPAGQDTVYAGTGRVSSGPNGNGGVGIYRSIDSGQTWTTLGAPQFTGFRVTGIQPTPVGAGPTQTILVADSGEGVGPNTGIWRSNNGGTSWTRLSGGAGLPAGDVTELVRGADVGSGNALKATYYAALSGTFDDNLDGKEDAADVSRANKGIYRGELEISTGNLTWVKLAPANAVVPSATQLSALNTRIAVHNSVAGGEVIYAGFVAPDPADKEERLAALAYSIDRGSSWNSMALPGTTEKVKGANKFFGIHPGGQGETHFSIAADPDDPLVVYVGGDRQPGGGGTEPKFFDDDPASGNSLHASNFTGRLFRADRSPFAPQLWQGITHKFANGSAPHADSRNILVIGSTLYEVDDGGIFRLSDLGSTAQVWDSLNTNLRTGEIYGIAYDPVNAVIMAGLQDIGAGQQRLVDDDGSGAIGNEERFHWESTLNGDATTQVTVKADDGTVYRFGMGLTQKDLVRMQFNASNTRLDTTFFDIGGLKGKDAKESDHVTQVLVPNAVDAGRFVYGLEALYESKADDDFDLSLVRIEKSPSSKKEPNRFGRVMAAAYGGRQNGVDQADVLYWARDNNIAVRRAGSGFKKGRDHDVTIAGAGTITEIVMDPEDWTRAFATDGFTIYQTADAGQTWNKLGDMNLVVQINALVAIRDGADLILFAAGLNGVYRLIKPPVAGTVKDTSWTRFGQGLPQVDVTDLIYSKGSSLISPADDVLVAATFGRGAWTLSNPLAKAQSAATIEVRGDASGNDLYTIRVNNIDPSIIEISVDSGPFQQFSSSTIDRIHIVGSNVSDRLTIDAQFGAPFLRNGIVFDAGGGNDQLALGPNTPRAFLVDGQQALPAGNGATAFDSSVNPVPTMLTYTSVDTQPTNLMRVSVASLDLFKNLSDVFRSDAVATAASGSLQQADALGGSMGGFLGGLFFNEPTTIALPSENPDAAGETESEPEEEHEEEATGGDPFKPGKPLLQRLIETGTGAFSLDELGTTITDAATLRQKLDDLDAIPGNVTLVEENGVTRFDMRVQKVLDGQASARGAALGGLLVVDGSLDMSARVTVHLVFGVDASGFFIDADSQADPTLVVDQFSAEAEGVAQLGFLRVGLTEGTLTTSPNVRLELDLHDPGTAAADGLIRFAELPQGIYSNALASVQVVGGAFGDGVADITLETGFEIDGFDFPVLDGLELRFTWDTIERNSIPAGAANLEVTPIVPAAQKLLDFLNAGADQVRTALNSLSSSLDEATGFDLFAVKVPVLNKTLGEIVNGQARPIALTTATFIASVGPVVSEETGKSFTVTLRGETPGPDPNTPGEPISIVGLGIAPGQEVHYKTTTGADAEGVVQSVGAGEFVVAFDGQLSQDPAADPQIEVVPGGGALANPLKGLLGSLTDDIPTLQDLVAELSEAIGFDLAENVDLVDGPDGLELRITLPFDPKPLVFDAALGLGDSIPGLSFDASGEFTVTVDPSFHITLGLRLGADIPLADRVYLLEDSQPEVALAIDVGLDDLDVGGSIGFLNVRLAETGDPVTNPGIVIHADLSLNLQDPVPDSDGGGRILLSDLPGHLLEVFKPSLSGSFTFGGFTLGADLGSTGLVDLALSLDGGPTVALNSRDDLTALPGKLRVDGNLADFTDFRNVTPQQILDMLDALIDQLTALGAGGIFEKPIPLVNKSFADLVNIGQSLGAKLGNPSGGDGLSFTTAKAFEDFLNSKISPGSDTVKIFVTGDDIRFVFTYTIAAPTVKAPLSFQLGGGRAFSPQIEGQGELDLSAGATVTLALGVRTGPDIPLAERVFLVADNAPVDAAQKTAFHVEGHANAGFGAGNAFSFTATIGPVQLGVVSGRAKLDASVNAGITDLGRANPNGLLTLAEIAQALQANQGASLFTGGVSAEVQAIVPIDGFDPGGSAPTLAAGALGTDAVIEVVGRLNNIANVTVDVRPETAPAVFTVVGQPLPSSSLPLNVIQVTPHNITNLLAGAFLDLGTLIDGLEQLIVWGKNLLGFDKLNFKLPLVGKPLGEVFDFFGGNGNDASIRGLITKLTQNAATAFNTEIDPTVGGASALFDQLLTALKNGLKNIPGIQAIGDADGDGLFEPLPGSTDDLLKISQGAGGVITGVEVLVKFAPSVNVPLSGGFDLGTSFLNLSGDVNLTLTGSLQILLGLGVDKQHGFYVRTDFSEFGVPAGTKDIMFHGDVRIGGSIDATLGFLKLGGVFDQAKNFLSADFNIDLNGGTTGTADENKILTFTELLDFGAIGQRFTAELPIVAKVDVDLSASVSSNLPSLGATLNVDWSFNAFTGNIPAPTVNLSKVHVDIGSFLDRVLKPILSRMQSLNIVPQQLIDLLNQPLPILNQTLFDVLIRPLNPDQQKVAKFLFNIAELIAEASDNADMASGLMLEFGGDVRVVPDTGNQLASSNTATAIVDPADENGKVNGEDVENTNPSAPGTGLPLIGPFIQKLADIGVTFPALKLSNLVKLFTGGDLDIVLVNPPNLKIDVEFNQTIPLFSAGIPYVADVYVSAFFGGGIHFQANVSAGFDTSGLKRGNFLGGIYLGDFDPVDGVIDPTDPERPELTLTADIHAGIDAGVRLIGLPIGRATGTASLTASLSVDLNDDNAAENGSLPDGRPFADHFDGKLHFHEIPTIVQSNEGNPLCLFELSGSLDAALSLRLFVALLFDKTISQEFHLLDFHHECFPTVTREIAVTDADDVDEPFQTVNLADLSPDRTRLTFTFANSDQLDAAAGTNSPSGDRVDVVLEDLNGDPTDGPDVVTIPAADVTVAELGDGSFTIGDATNPQFLINGVIPGMSVLYTNSSGQLEFGTIIANTNETLTVRPIDPNGKGPKPGAAVTVRSGKETLKVLKGGWFERFGPLELVNNNPAASPNYVADIRSIVTIDGARGFQAGDDRVRIDPLITAAVSLNGGDGNDTLVGGSGHNTLNGGPGDDLLQIAYAPDGLSPAERQARASTFNGGSGDDTIIAGVGDDVLNGGPGDDNLDGFGAIAAATNVDDALKTTYGPGGRDTINGNGGDDTINGRDDNDRLVGDNPGFSSLEGRDTIAGGDGDDTIWGDNAPISGLADGPAPAPGRPTGDSIVGGFGVDTIFAGAGADFVDGDGDPAGSDQGTSGADSIFGGPGDDTLIGRGGADTIVGEAGDDRLDGGDGDDALFGGDAAAGPANPGSPTGGLGHDSALGGAGNDAIDAADSDSLIAQGGTGNDTIMGTRGADRLEGDDGRDFLIGGPGPDELDGGNGDDDLVTGRGGAGGVSYSLSGAGRDGDDLISASAGADVVIPGAGTINPATRVPTLASTTADPRSLDVSTYPAGITIDLDSSAVQTFAAGRSLRLARPAENFLGTPQNDIVNVRPLALPRLLQGGGGTGDALTIDALGATVLVTPGSVIFTATPAGIGPFGPLSFSGFATVTILNAAASVAIAADSRSNTATVRLSSTQLAFSIEDGPAITIPGATSANFRALAGDDDITIDTRSGPVTLNGGGGMDGFRLFQPLSGGTVTAVDAPVLVGDVTSQASTTTSRLSGQIDLGGAARIFDVADGGAAIDLALEAALTGSASATKRGLGTLALTGNSPAFSGRWNLDAGVLRADGNSPSSPVSVSGGTLAGVGTVGGVNVTGGVLDPGGVGTIGQLTISGNLDMTSRGTPTFRAQMNATTFSASSDRVNVLGRVNLDHAELDATSNANVPLGAAFTIINNAGNAAVTGTFSGLAEGTVFAVNGQAMQITYRGGDGNDVVLTRVNQPPKFPNRAITAEIVEGGIAVLTGQISEPDELDSFRLDIDWGDGVHESLLFPPGSSRDVRVTHRFLDDPPTPDDRAVVHLVWSDPHGGSNSGDLTVKVANRAPAVESFTPSGRVVEGRLATFRVAASDPGADPITLVVNWGDGTPATRVVLPPGSGLASLAHRYAAGGAYLVRVSASDGDGGAGVLTRRLVVSYSSTARATVGAAFLKSLGRNPSADELSFWTGRLARGVPASALASTLAGSPEGRTRTVRAVFQSLLHRPPVPQELNLWLGRVGRAGGANELRVALVASDEYFRSHGGTPSGFVDAAFRDLLGRAPGRAERIRLVNALGSGTSRASVVRRVLREGR